ncbi:hypothetical protein AMECASPLE_028384 [Ameca splendens]|uniref:Uncharacterized protein n=1 Tax=Ameca splendens TaxID=208324 RepID=A0ABV0ZEA8_9TELE
MNATMFYRFLRKKTKLALPVDGSEDELGFSDEENEQLATQQGESEVDRDSENIKTMSQRMRTVETARKGGAVRTGGTVRVNVQLQFTVGESATIIYVLH